MVLLSITLAPFEATIMQVEHSITSRTRKIVIFQLARTLLLTLLLKFMDRVVVQMPSVMEHLLEYKSNIMMQVA